MDIGRRYEITFLEIGVDQDRAHFLLQSVPVLSPSRLAQTVKSLRAREGFARLPGLKRQLWGRAFWSTESSGYFINTVGHHGSEDTIRRYVREQGREPEYQALHTRQLELF